ncbi:MAG: hypothetical protein GY865_10435 [candidate division Zixibacteria bacterium]|nr:hypothetical protein [candidate division Zixibacteria bacterium]
MNKKIFMAINLTAILLLAVFFFFSSERAKSSNTDYDSLVNEFFNKVDSGDFNGAVDYIYSSNPWILKNSSDGIQNVKNKLSDLPALTGKFLSRELLGTEELTNKFIIVNYIVFTERQPFRFYFTFYRPGDNWMTYSFGFDDDLDEWLEEKAKVNCIWSDD